MTDQLSPSSVDLDSPTADPIAGSAAWVTRSWLESRLLGGSIMGPLSALVVLGVLIAGGVAATIIWQLNKSTTIDAIKVGLTVAGGIGGAAALLMALRKQFVLEQDKAGALEERKISAEAKRSAAIESRDIDAAFRERYGAAATQLGSGEAAVRLAGVYAMANLADDWIAQRQQCVDVLCAYLRLPPLPAGTRERSGDDVVRRTIIAQFRHHLDRFALPGWRELDFNLTGAFLPGMNFDGIWLEGSLDLSNATLNDSADFREAVFMGRTSFIGAVFEGLTSFNASSFRAPAVFRGAKFLGPVVFDGVHFDEPAIFSEVVFSGSALFNNTSFGPVRFIDAQFLLNAEFTISVFNGPTDFMGANFGPVDFAESWFLGHTAFRRVVFQSRPVSDGEGRDIDGVRFHRATFAGPTTFDRASFWQKRGAVFSAVQTGDYDLLRGAHFD